MTRSLDGENVPVRPHNTGRGRNSLQFGVDALAVEIERGMWTFRGLGDPQIDACIRDMISYNPDEHCGDRLAALTFARAAAEQRDRRAGWVELDRSLLAR